MLYANFYEYLIMADLIPFFTEEDKEWILEKVDKSGDRQRRVLLGEDLRDIKAFVADFSTSTHQSGGHDLLFQRTRRNHLHRLSEDLSLMRRLRI